MTTLKIFSPKSPGQILGQPPNMITSAQLLLMKTEKFPMALLYIENHHGFLVDISSYIDDVPDVLIHYCIEKSFRLRGTLYQQIFDTSKKSEAIKNESMICKYIYRVIEAQDSFPPKSYISLLKEMMNIFILMETTSNEFPWGGFNNFLIMIEETSHLRRVLKKGEALSFHLEKVC
ncbi:MAG: hypothetical protein KDD45_04765 [Bdellovibrionales bacterium]|nr:hypothetical protein [Bdellovibrionales bacterium]